MQVAIAEGMAQRVYPDTVTVGQVHTERQQRFWAAGIFAQPDLQRPPQCVVEIAPGCVYSVPNNGLDISRDFLLCWLPALVVATEHARTCLQKVSRLESVSNELAGHCSISWVGGWQLVAHGTIYTGDAIYNSGDILHVLGSTSVLLGFAGWPITVRVDSTHIPL